MNGKKQFWNQGHCWGLGCDLILTHLLLTISSLPQTGGWRRVPKGYSALMETGVRQALNEWLGLQQRICVYFVLTFFTFCKKVLLTANIWENSMDRSTLAQQVESVERNVAFLQQEHRILLTGLRLEIRNLKKRCNGPLTSSSLYRFFILNSNIKIIKLSTLQFINYDLLRNCSFVNETVLSQNSQVSFVCKALFTLHIISKQL